MIFDKNGKRLLIYFFYDKDGVVDRYIDYMLNDITKHVDDVIVVCNGKLCEEDREIFERYAKHVIVRKNEGFDVWAYKTALEYVGLDRLSEYDEVIMMNFTIMGPLYPFSEMFDVMDEKDIDFWGLTLFHGVSFDPFGKIKYGYLPTHIQSHFIAVRSKMLASNEFKEYWKNMPMITSYEEAIGYHEAIFTKTFADYGYKWEAYIDTRDEQDRCYCPIIMCPKSLVKDRRCPIFKRRSFFHDYRDMLEYTTGEATVELLDYIQHNLDYDVDMIYENILRLENQADIKRNMHMTYILPNGVDNAAEIDITGKRIALVIHIYFEDLIDYCYQYALSMPESCDIYVTTNASSKKAKIESVFAKGPWKNVQVIQIENRGRDVSALLVATKEFIYDYDYVCFMHDKKVGQLDVSIKGESFSYKCFENLLKSRLFVKNVINTFEQNDRLGMMMPPPPNFADYYPTIGKVDWGENFYNTVQLAHKLDIHIKMDQSKEPIAPLGTMFWFRPKALKRLYDKDWSYEDFPKEPNNADGTILHAIERVYPYVVQAEGYYPAWIMNEQFASIEVDNLYFMLREMNRAVFDMFGANRHLLLVDQIQNTRVVERPVGKLYICTQDGFNEKDTENYMFLHDDRCFRYGALQKYGEVSEFRWDPGDLGGIEVRIPEIEIKLDNGDVIYKGFKDVRTNGVVMDDTIAFFEQDPQIYFSIPEKAKIDSICVIAHVDKGFSHAKAERIKRKLMRRKDILSLVQKIRKRFIKK